MKTVRILIGHEGYPSGRKRIFRKGAEPSLPDDYAALVVGKGLAEEVGADPAGVKSGAKSPAKGDRTGSRRS